MHDLTEGHDMKNVKTWMKGNPIIHSSKPEQTRYVRIPKTGMRKK